MVSRSYGTLALATDARSWVLSGLEPHVAIRMKAMFPRIDKTRTSAFRFPNTAEMCADLSWFLQRYPMRMNAADLEAGEPVLLAGWHREVYAIWREELAAFNPVLYTGSETASRKDAAKQAFISGETNLMMISLRSGAGLDGLQKRCATVVFGELDWSPKVHDQVIGRLDRPGQSREVTALFLHADGGSDPVVIGLLGLKASQSKGIVDPLSGQAQVHTDFSRVRRLAERFLETHKAAA